MAGREGKRGECQTALALWFGAKAAQSERPSEPRPSGAHPEEAVVGKDGVAFRLKMTEGCLLMGVSAEEADTANL